MQKELLRSITVMLACIVLLVPIGCGGGSSNSSGGGRTAYTLGGTLAGLGVGQNVSLQDNGGDKLTLSANGAFSFPTRIQIGTTYAVTVQSHTPGIACSVSNGSGTVGSSDVTGIGVSCYACTERILYSFGANPTDGQQPYAGLMMDSAGNLYGTTQNGGTSGLGTVFKITADGTETILHSFGASVVDGQIPRGGVIMDTAGNLYGTTTEGGAHFGGTVFRISASGTETILYSFGTRANDGMDPYGSLIMDSAGNLYGTTGGGGSGGMGTVYKIDPAGTETVLYSFGEGSTAVPYTDGAAPSGGVIMDSAGNLYGTTSQGGAHFEGTAFKISAAGTETILYSFGASPTDGRAPAGGLIMDSAGNLYGTTAQGGANISGTVFKLDAAGNETILYAFAPRPYDGRDPNTGVITDSSGSLYGTTASGGANNNGDPAGGYGTVFKVSAAGTETILFSFGASATDGMVPFAGLIVDGAGNLYGTTVNGGPNFGTVVNGFVNGGGTVFVID